MLFHDFFALARADHTFTYLSMKHTLKIANYVRINSLSSQELMKQWKTKS